MHPQDSITWTPAYTFTVGTSNYIPLRSSGRFTAVKFSSSASARWNLSSYDIEYDEGGIYSGTTIASAALSFLLISATGGALALAPNTLNHLLIS
jgi:hypothetical protein